MTKICKTLALCVGASAFAWAGLSLADEDNHGRDFQAKLRLRAEYDDNIYGQGSDVQSSTKVEAEVEFIYNLNLVNSYIGLRYRPTFVYWFDRPSDDSDLHHEFDVDFNHSFSPRATLALKNSFLYAELPELMDRGAIVQQKDSYFYNRANADFSYQVQPNTKASVAGRYTVLRYENNDVSENEDYDIYAAGLTLRHQLSVATTISGEARYEDIAYNGADRDSDSIYVGAGIEQMFGPDLLGSLRGGFQRKEFSADVDTANEPYVDASVTVLSPSHRTRVTTGVGYSMFEADVFPYASQDRVLVFVSASHDLTARVSLFLSGSYQNSSYNGDQSVDQATASKDGSEEVMQVSARGAYKINNNNWVEAGYQYLKLESDIRDDFDRNRVSVGWRMTL